jgi:uncharacterized protein (DUF433 family)
MDNLLSRIAIDEEICGGRPTIKDTRITVKTILEYIAAGETMSNILQAYPILTKEDILACVAFAAKMLEPDFTIKDVA